MSTATRLLILASALAFSTHCSSPSNMSADAGPDADHMGLDSSHPGSDSGTPNGDGAGGNDVPIASDGGGNPLGPTFFRRGDNPGYYGPGIDRRESAQLTHQAGANSIRTPLPESYLAMWGDNIEVGDWAYYATLGIDHEVCFLIGPTAEHSTAPAGTPTWELDHYSPRNLYEPIFLADGTVNPNNYWAAYIARVAQNYGDHIDVYEVWNEPDQVGGNWQATMAWATMPPHPADLIWWNDTVFSYVRALRIAHEVVHHFDPTGQVTVGGVGYSNFLRAVLRYTDEPTAGMRTTDYPQTGAAYLDVLSYHYYPIFSPGSSDVGVDGFIQARDDMRTALHEAGVDNLSYVVTETGAPRYAIGTATGGVDYSANYLLKTMTLAHFEGFVGVDWFAQGDGAAPGASTDPLSYSGLFLDYSAAQMPSDVHISPQGQAYAWLATWLEGTAPDRASLTALSLPASVRGAAFAMADGSHRYVLWARSAADESATAMFALPATGAVRVRSWTASGGEHADMRTPAGGTVALTLTATPTVIDAPH